MPADRMTQARVAERRAGVLRALAAGFSFEQIAGTVEGVTSAKAAAQDAARGLADQVVLRKLATGGRDLLLELELTSLASAQRAVEGIMRRAASDPGKGDVLVLKSAGQLLRIAERRHVLQGLTDTAAEGPADELADRRRRVGTRRRGIG
jgi:hypothetical protein